MAKAHRSSVRGQLHVRSLSPKRLVVHARVRNLVRVHADSTSGPVDTRSLELLVVSLLQPSDRAAACRFHLAGAEFSYCLAQGRSIADYVAVVGNWFPATWPRRPARAQAATEGAGAGHAGGAVRVSVQLIAAGSFTLLGRHGTTRFTCI